MRHWCPGSSGCLATPFRGSSVLQKAAQGSTERLPTSSLKCRYSRAVPKPCARRHLEMLPANILAVHAARDRHACSALGHPAARQFMQTEDMMGRRDGPCVCSPLSFTISTANRHDSVKRRLSFPPEALICTAGPRDIAACRHWSVELDNCSRRQCPSSLRSTIPFVRPVQTEICSRTRHPVLAKRNVIRARREQILVCTHPQAGPCWSMAELDPRG